MQNNSLQYNIGNYGGFKHRSLNKGGGNMMETLQDLVEEREASISRAEEEFNEKVKKFAERFVGREIKIKTMLHRSNKDCSDNTIGRLLTVHVQRISDITTISKAQGQLFGIIDSEGTTTLVWEDTEFFPAE